MLEQGFGKNDVLTLTYLGAAGRKLMQRIRATAQPPAQPLGAWDYVE